jgi:hypothetical protein
VGVKFRGNTGDDTLRQRVEEAEVAIAEAASGEETVTAGVKHVTVTNVSKNRRRICTVDLAVGERHTLTAADMENDRLMAKITRALELGVLESD